MSHVDEGTLHAYLDGELSALEVARVEAHVAECAPCRARLDEERDVIARASRILALAEPPERATPPLHALPYRRPGWRVRWPLAWAATLVLAISIGWFMRAGFTAREEPASDLAPLYALPQAAPVDTTITARELAQREAPAPPPAPTEVPRAGAPSVNAQRADSVAAAPGLATRDTTTPQVALAETIRDSAPRRVAQHAVAPLAEERAARAYVTPDGARLADTLELDQARALVDGDIYAVSGLPVTSIMRGRMIGYASIVVVEQPLDSNTVIRVETRRPTTLALDAVVVTGAAQGERARADSPAANLQLRGQVRPPGPPTTAAPPLTRQVAGLEIHIAGPLAPDSLRKLLEKAAPIR